MPTAQHQRADAWLAEGESLHRDPFRQVREKFRGDVLVWHLSSGPLTGGPAHLEMRRH